MTPDEKDAFIAWLWHWLEATNPEVDTSALWQLLATRVGAAIGDAKRLSNEELEHLVRACKEYETLRGRKNLNN